MLAALIGQEIATCEDGLLRIEAAASTDVRDDLIKKFILSKLQVLNEASLKMDTVWDEYFF